DRIAGMMKTEEVLVITGIRRSGKSTVATQFCKTLIDSGVKRENVLIVNFEDPRFKNLSPELFIKIYDTYVENLMPEGKKYILLDEIQVIEGWERFVRYLHEVKKDAVIVTGSSSKLLSSEYATVLSGRHVDTKIYPLGFSEFLKFKNVVVKDRLDLVSKKHEIASALNEYLIFGGFPRVALLKEENLKWEILKAYFTDIIIKDVASRHRISKLPALEDLTKYYLTNVSSLHSFDRLKKTFKVSRDTIQRFSKYLQDVYLLFFVPKFSYSLKEQTLNPKKVYCMDNGIRNAVCYRFMEEKGKLFENLVAVELLRRGNEFYYWKDGRHEVDFVIKEGMNVTAAVQVCYNLEREETKKREMDALARAMDDLNLSEGLVITEDYEGEDKIEDKVIRFLPLWKFLLGT
ncbi:MAG: ATPase, partial [Elusimicrobia bacterium HGW-Elusimicrobia-4]